jgi:copper chaperone CopZ
VSVAIKKVDGVQDVKVSLNEGSAEVKLKDGNKVTVDQVRELIRKNGFTPKQSEVKVLGKVIERDGKPALDVTGLDLVYLLEGDASKLKGMIGKEVLVTGQLPEATDKIIPPGVVVKEVSPAS